MDLIEEVAELVRNYRGTHEGRSISWFARRSGVPYSTVRGILQREVRDTKTENVVALLSVFMSHGDIIDLLRRHGRDAKLRTMYQAQRDYQFLEGPGFEWKSPDHAIVALASTRSGVTRERIEELFGKETGANRLEILLDSGMLREINGRIKSFSENFTDPNLNSVARQIEIHAQSWNSSQIDKGGFNTIKSHDLSNQAFEKIKDVMRNALDSVYEIVEQDKDNKKDVVMLLNFLCSVYEAEK